MGAAELRAFTYDMALSTSGDLCTCTLPVEVRPPSQMLPFHTKSCVALTKKLAEYSTEKGYHRTEQKPFVTYLSYGQLYLLSFTSFQNGTQKLKRDARWMKRDGWQAGTLLQCILHVVLNNSS